ncbi:cytochrome d ubiquinol oxidase subunit II [Polycladidibacter stylochi]|uniref:cytochrome d ubiquinol oxidase subunit II n=1 Tax=Polycladidibacter stylochi TaxID=1807766 RepID=UPI0008308C53|nr:cytochrome d ubiquinol oxidase subunit II [Pseudovibrio stylochi]
MDVDYALIWAILIAFAIFAYVVLDGFDLGVGILYPTTHDDEERSLMMNTIAPVWDGNETWLILGGGGLLAVFPLAYAVIMPALYIPIITMLLGLIFRGVAFEFRFKAGLNHRRIWDFSFFFGSVLAAFSQGAILGALIEGLEISGRQFSGGAWDWLSPFSVLIGVSLIIGYALLGATWLVLKLEGPVCLHFRKISNLALLMVIGCIGAVSLATLYIRPDFVTIWFDSSTILYSFAVPLLIIALFVTASRSLSRGPDYVPFLCALAVFLLSYIGLGMSLYPFIVPMQFTIWQAAAPESSLKFLLGGAAFLIPLILAYTGYAYWVFRGKLRKGEGYH